MAIRVKSSQLCVYRYFLLSILNLKLYFSNISYIKIQKTTKVLQSDLLFASSLDMNSKLQY